jgi:short-subunit dehydrogenase
VVAGRLDQVAEDDIREMVALDLLAPILLTREALPALREGDGGTVVLVSSAIALVGLPFYSTYGGVKAGLAHVGEALRRELHGEGVDVLVAYPGATDTPMMESSDAGPELGFDAEPAEDVARAIVGALREDRRDVIRGGEVRLQMVETNREHPEKVDQRFAGMKDDLEQAVKDHRSV